jgi:predicted RNase H-like HicB family nuclease
MPTYTLVYKKVPEGWIGSVEEVPGANTQGSTIEETQQRLREALGLLVDDVETATLREIIDAHIWKDDDGD